MQANRFKAILSRSIAASALLVATSAAFAGSVNLTPAPANASLPDGQGVPMWGYRCDATQPTQLRSRNAGAHGYVLKDSGRADLLQAIRVVVNGGQYLCASVSARVVSGFVHGADPKPGRSPESLMMLREKQVLTRIALGHPNKIIARDLGLSVKTVEKHRSNLMRKLTLHNAAAVTLFALRHGFIEATGGDAHRAKAAI